MTGKATIGALNVMIGLDSAEFVGGLRKAQGELKRAAREMAAVGQNLRDMGRNLSLGLTLPMAAFGVASVKAAGNFEASMIKVGISTKATASEMAALESQARTIGKATVFSASEAADAMDMLAKTGLGVGDILGGAAKAAVDLAAAADSQLEPAASAISDSMQQFKLSASQLPGVVNQITGAVNESKLSFEDFTQASGQAGGVAANLGVSFEDFNAVLAGTSSLFSSGSDAGTSFKTFLTTLTPKSDEAAAAMQKYGLRFYEANGALKSMSSIAEELRTKLGDLNDEAKTEVLRQIFGTDAMRTAIGLMTQGAAGLDLIRKKIQETDAAAQAAKRMEGFNGQLKQLQGAAEDLGIAIGKTGVLNAATDLIKGLTDLIESAADLDPALLKASLGAAALVAAMGPANFAVGLLATGASKAMLAVASLTAGAGGLKVAMTALGALIGPGGLIVLGLGAAAAVTALYVQHMADLQKPTAEVAKTSRDLAVATEAYDKAARLAAGATGEARKQFTMEAAAAKEAAAQKMKSANASLALARANLAAIQSENRAAIGADRYSARGDAAGTIKPILNQGKMTKAQADIDALTAQIAAAAKSINDSQAILNAAEKAVRGGSDGGASAAAGSGASAAASTAKADALKKEAEARKEAADAIRDYLAAEQKSVAQEGLTQNQIKAQELRAKAHEANLAGMKAEAEALWDLADAYLAGDIEFQKLADTQVDFVNSTADLKVEFKSTWDKVLDQAEEGEQAFREMRYAVDDIYYGFKNRDWAGAFAGLARALEQLRVAFSQAGTTAQKMAAVATAASTVGSAIGGKTGSAISDGVGIYTAAAPLVGAPIAAAAAALYAAAKLLNVGGKPSNAGAGYDLRTGQLSGDKRTSETEQAAKTAAGAIEEIQKGLKAAGIQLTDEIVALVLGTRDETQIYLRSGKTLRSAVGDAGAAADAAFKALLEGATYASEAQKTLVQSMVAAGKGFDQISAALQTYAEAQKLGDNIGDEILRLTDPKAYDLAGLEDAQAERRKALQAYVDEGYITVDQLAALNVQLGRLEDLELDEVLAKYGEGVKSIAEIQAEWNDRIAASQAKVADAQDEARDAYERERDAAEALRDTFDDVADSLAGFRRELTAGDVGGLDPAQQLAAAQAAFDAVAGKTDAASLSKLPEVGRALIDAQKALAPNAQVLAATTNQVRQAVIAGEAAARAQVSEAQRQIDALDNTATHLGLLNTNIVTFAAAQEKLAAANDDLADVMRDAAAAIAGTGASMAAAAAAAAAAITAAPPPVTSADVAAALSPGGLNASVASMASDPGLAQSLATELTPFLRQIVVNTGETARGVDDNNYLSNLG